MAENDEKPDAEASQDPKTKFREALERKKSSLHRTADGSLNTGAVHGSETKGPAQRSFRRRAGSA